MLNLIVVVYPIMISFATISFDSLFLWLFCLNSLSFRFKIAFYKENFIVLLRIVLSIFWLFVLPGYFIMLYWKEKIGFIERIVVGISIAAAIIGIFSYYISLAGLNLKFHAIVLPLVLILVGIS